MAKYSTDSSKSSDSEKSDEDVRNISIPVNKWLIEAIEMIRRQSSMGAGEAIRGLLQYAVIEWNRNFERQSETLEMLKDFEMPGGHIWEPDFRCLNCKSANKYLFRKIGRDTGKSQILCLNCDEEMSREEVTRLARAVEIQEMPPYSLEHEGTKLKHKHEGKPRTPMRFECSECDERDLTLPDPSKVEALVCPRCGNKGKILNQHKGPAVSNFVKYGPDKYHTTESDEPIGRNISRGEYDHLEKSYKDGHEL